LTDRFVVSAREMATIQGLPDYPFAVIAHPIAANSSDELRDKAQRVVGAIVSLLTARRA
jgi:hypothetical protein